MRAKKARKYAKRYVHLGMTRSPVTLKCAQADIRNGTSWAMCSSISTEIASFLRSGGGYFLLNGPWDLVIAHPPCTDLACSGARWFPEKQKDFRQQKGVVFFMRMVLCNAEHIAVENPVGIMSSCYRKPDQMIQPWQFGDPFEKQTCLWLKGLPKLESTKIVEPPPRQQIKGGKSMPEWYSNAPKAERGKIRSKTFPGIAQAMAEQWSEYIMQQEKRRLPFKDEETVFGWRCGVCNFPVAHEQRYCEECGTKMVWEDTTDNIDYENRDN